MERIFQVRLRSARGLPNAPTPKVAEIECNGNNTVLRKSRFAIKYGAGRFRRGAARDAHFNSSPRFERAKLQKSQRALAGQALRAARLHGTRQLNADEVIGARQPIGASAVQGRGIHTRRNEKINKRSRRRSARGRKSFRLLAELSCPSTDRGAFLDLLHG